MLHSDLQYSIEPNKQVSFDDFQSQTVTKILIKEGYDAIEIGGDWVLVIIADRTQVAVFKVKEL